MNLFNDDFIDFIESLNRHKVDYVLVGGYAVIIRGYSRTTGDIDLWVNRSPENYTKLIAAIVQFGLPQHALPIEKFLSEDFDVFSFGRPPYSIEIMTAVKGLDFSETHSNATLEEIDGIRVNVIHINQLKQAKKASGRNKDLNDLENLPE
jgi:hypothetical protein